MATDLNIANLALSRIGHDPLSGAFASDGNKASRWFYTNYDIIRKAILRSHQWKFATKKAVLTKDAIRTITGITAASPPVVTSAAHGFSDADVIYIDGVIGMTSINGKTYTVANQATNTFELSGVDASAYSAYSSAGSAYAYVAKDFAYRFAVPSDNLRILRVNELEIDTWRLEQGYIYTDEGEIWVEYIYDAQTETEFDDMFVDVFAARLSAEISFYLTDNSTLTEQSWNIYNQKIRDARTMDAREGTPRGFESSTWLDVRV